MSKKRAKQSLDPAAAFVQSAEDVDGADTPQEDDRATGAGPGRPPKDRPQVRRANITLYASQVERLDRIAFEAKMSSGEQIDRSMLLRAIVEPVLDKLTDELQACQDEEEIVALIDEHLR